MERARPRGSMGYKAELDSEHRALLITFRDSVTLEELQNALGIASRHVAANGPCHGILDFTGVTDWKISAETAAGVGRSPRILPAGWLRIHVAPSEFMYGTLRQYSVYQGDQSGDYHLVRSIKAAFALISKEPLRFEPVES